MASNYNRVLRPPVVFVSGGTSARRRPARDASPTCSLVRPDPARLVPCAGGRPSIGRAMRRRCRARRSSRLRQRRGFAFARLIDSQAEAIALRTGLELEITRIAVKDPSKATSRLAAIASAAPSGCPPTPRRVVNDPDDRRRRRAHRWHRAGPEPGARRAPGGKARRHGATRSFSPRTAPSCSPPPSSEGSTCSTRLRSAGRSRSSGSSPTRSAGERIVRVMGIVNGTTNYMLTSMSEEGSDYADALAEAQALGYAEADPTADVEGFDARAKAAILAGIAFDADVVAERRLPRRDHRHRRLGHRLRPPARLRGEAARRRRARRRRAEAVPSRCASIPPWSRVSIRSRACAGPSTPSSSKARAPASSWSTAAAQAGPRLRAPSSATWWPPRITFARRRGAEPSRRERVEIRPISELRTQYYLTLDVTDRPGVLAAVAHVFGEHHVSIRSMEQVGLGDEARLVFITHTAREADVQATLASLAELDVVRRIGGVLRVIGPER